MAAPYSDDFRHKVIEALKREKSKSLVCRMFNISRNTLDLWLKQLEQTGSISANRNYKRGPKPKIDDLEAFRVFAQEHGHLTQKEMAQFWPEPISDRTISEALKRIGFTRKKRLTATASVTRRNEQLS